ncbi:MAG: 23S rRNA (adenine(2030)-N(6))-methyltransferase RlmJ [Parvularculaceae bacterium]|nr:23S rRNA (adenine(2030)-N(6))-methyltransferase RlmJ [Parvularculaceae bacterium]
MNYRHAFHAGNHCDVLKHAALVLILARLAAKDKPFAVLDTHAGRGVYDLESDAARRSAEHLGGIGRVFEMAAPPPAIEPYLAAVRWHNPFGGLRWYPGSPAIIRDALREGDDLKLCELHPEEREALTTAMAGDARVRIFGRDGYQAVRAFLPPAARRGLVVIDPPFEAPGEYARLAEALRDGLKRWASGTFMIWHPLKDARGYADFLHTVHVLAPPRLLTAELMVKADAPGVLSGSGLVVVNPTFGLADSLREILPFLAEVLGAGEGPGWRLRAEEAGEMMIDAQG